MGYLPVLEIEKLTLKKGGRGLHLNLDDHNVIYIPSSNIYIGDNKVTGWIRATIYNENTKEVGYIPFVKMDEPE